MLMVVVPEDILPNSRRMLHSLISSSGRESLALISKVPRPEFITQEISPCRDVVYTRETHILTGMRPAQALDARRKLSSMNFIELRFRESPCSFLGSLYETALSLNATTFVHPICGTLLCLRTDSSCHMYKAIARSPRARSKRLDQKLTVSFFNSYLIYRT
jgi:hypothetical protein